MAWGTSSEGKAADKAKAEAQQAKAEAEKARTEDQQAKAEAEKARGEAAGAQKTAVTRLMRDCGWHLMGTCTMGEDPATSVVNPRLEVHALERPHARVGLAGALELEQGHG